MLFKVVIFSLDKKEEDKFCNFVFSLCLTSTYKVDAN